MDPFNTVNSALIFSGIYHSIKEIRLKMAVTRAVHALVVLSMLMPGASVMAAPSLGENIIQVVELPESSIPKLEEPHYQLPVFEHQQPRIGRAASLPDLSNQERPLLDPTPTPTPDPENPTLPPMLPALGQPVEGQGILPQAFGAEPLNGDQAPGLWDQLVSGGPSDETYPVSAYIYEKAALVKLYSGESRSSLASLSILPLIWT